MTIDLNAQGNYASTMFVTALAKYISWSFSVVIASTFLYSYFGTEDRIGIAKDLAAVSIVTGVTELLSPVVAFFLIVATAGCNRTTDASDPAFNTAFCIPEEERARLPEQYEQYMKEEHPEQWATYFAQVAQTASTAD